MEWAGGLSDGSTLTDLRNSQSLFEMIASLQSLKRHVRSSVVLWLLALRLKNAMVMRVFSRAVVLYERILCHDHRGRGVTFVDTHTPHFLVSTINVIPSGLMWCLLVICLRCTDKLILLLLSHFKCWESERITYYYSNYRCYCLRRSALKRGQ